MEEKIMPFAAHLRELRNRLLVCMFTVLVLSVLGYYLYFPIIKFLSSPFGETLYARHITEGFVTRLNVAFFTGLTLSIPVIVASVLGFVFPALDGKNRKILTAGVAAGGMLFLAGAVFAYKLILPSAIAILKSASFIPEGVARQFLFQDSVKFAFQFLLAFGAAFQLPVVLVALMAAGVVKRKTITKHFRIAVVICFIVAAVLTPPDVLSQLMLAVPLVALYGLSILAGVMFKLGE
jgi:sec-independent protein translocase protein TatC